MKLLVAHGADPNIPTDASRPGRPRGGDAGSATCRTCRACRRCRSAGPACTPLHAAAGVGYGEGFAANAHRFAPTRHAGGREVPRRGAAAPTSTRATTTATRRCTTPPRAATTR